MHIMYGEIIMDNEFSLLLPYPTVTSAHDERDLNRLYDLYAGRFSEMTSTCTYVYQNIISGESCLARLLGGIAMVEMHHLNLLGNAIFALGGDPVFAGRYNFFSGRYADYEKDVKVFLQNDIIAEQNAAESYRSAAELSDNPELKDLLIRIAMDEDLHIELLTNCYKEFEKVAE